ncbi:unnamed protein product [Cuscuta epithymum]|uniref:Retrotransposon gag domain-containing protein n=1 Tax=Cuscuta epithymum TaxID=186058 RepID=A0AAV0E433_9ASTE|nr:unnamed protein product [Cuscuta epithymum]
MAESSNALMEDIKAQLQAVREELRLARTSNPSADGFQAQMEAVREEMRQRMAFLQKENDALRSQVQSVASIASNSRRGKEIMYAASRWDTDPIPASTSTLTFTTESFPEMLNSDPNGGLYSPVISQLVPYEPLILETNPATSIPMCFFPDSLRTRPPTTSGLQIVNQQMSTPTTVLAPTVPFVPHSGTTTSGGAGPSSRSAPLPNPRRNIFRNSFTKSQKRQVPGRDDMCGGVDIGNQRRQHPEVVTIQSPTEQRTPQAATHPEVVRPQIQTNMTDPFAVIMEELRELREKVNSIPGVPRALDVATQTCYADSPFGRHITDVEIPRKFIVPSMKLFDGTADPVEHVAQYKQKMLAILVRPDQREACMCRAFGTTLTGPALTWFVNLPNDGINSFAELVNLFNQQFASSRVLEKRTSDLYRVVQGHNESLRDYLHRFNKEKVSIPRCHIPTTIEAFRIGLLEDSELYIRS